MPLDVLLDAITREGEAEAQQIVDEARAKAAHLRAAADASTSQRVAAAVAMKEGELRAVGDARRAGAHADARARTLHARSQFLERVFREVEATLPGLLDQGDTLERLVNEAKVYFPDEAIIVRCRPGLAARLSAVADRGIEIAPDESVPEGVIVEVADRRARIENTLVARLRRLRPALSVDLLAAIREEP